MKATVSCVRGIRQVKDLSLERRVVGVGGGPLKT
jgi:hypothetical protein